jgi:hypothetical protein
MMLVTALNPLTQALSLPASFFGEAAVVALAFSLPALMAGLWIGAQHMTQRLGGRTVAVVAGSVVVAIGFGAALHVAAPATDMTSLVRAVIQR